jgi:hypothetical protein
MTAGHSAGRLKSSVVPGGFATIVVIMAALVLAVALVAITISARKVGTSVAAPNVAPYPPHGSIWSTSYAQGYLNTIDRAQDGSSAGTFSASETQSALIKVRADERQSLIDSQWNAKFRAEERQPLFPNVPVRASSHPLRPQ